MNRGLVAVFVAGIIAAAAVIVLMRDDGAESPSAVSEENTETLHHYVDFEPVAGSPIAAPFTATYEPANLVVTGSVVLSDGSHTFTLAAQQIDILEGPGCPVVTDTPAP